MKSMDKKNKYFAVALGVVSAISISTVTVPQEALAQNSSQTCLSNTSDEAECKDCCDCLDADATTRKSCRDACATIDFSQNDDFVAVTVPSTLGADGDYLLALDTGNEKTCKQYCDGSSELICGDRRFCRDACNAAFGDADSQAQPDNNDGDSPSDPQGSDNMSIEQALSDEAQMKTIAFSGLAFLTGDQCSNTFFPPGKVSDFFGFQYLRDITPNGFGHNTEFAGRISDSVLSILTDAQVQELVDMANTQADQVDAYGYKRFSLIKAFLRLLENDLPDGSTGLDKSAVTEFTGDLYEIDAEISYTRAQVLGDIVAGLSEAQKTEFSELLNAFNTLFEDAGMGGTIDSEDWPATNPVDLSGLTAQDGRVLVSTYATQLFSWYLGSIEGDTYFCPERHGTYFGSFYMKDIPPISASEAVTIAEGTTAEMGQAFLDALNDSQTDLVTSLVDIQRTDLNSIVSTRQAISEKLRLFMDGTSVDKDVVLSMIRQYGEYEGEMMYHYASNFATVGNSLTDAQEVTVQGLRTGYYEEFADFQADSSAYECSGAWLYASKLIEMPEIENTDFLFGVGDAPVDSTDETSSLIADGAESILLADGFSFAEGPAADMYGNVYFSDIFENRIYRWSSESGVTLYRANSGGSNGLFVDHHGNLLAAEGGNKRVVVIDGSGNAATLADSYNNQQLNEPNDLWGTADGGIYFTDPVYNGSQSQDGEHVYYFSRKDNTLIRVIDDMIRPNGIVGSADGSTLYVTDHGAKQTFQYTINRDGTLSGKTLFASVGGDGMTLDSNGNLYIAEENVLVYDPSGNLLETIQLPEQPTNLCFGGTGGTLFITTRSALYSLEMLQETRDSRDDNIDATYDSTTKLIDLPSVSVDNEQYFKVIMQLTNSEPALLELTEAILIDSSEGVSATYDTSTDILSIPKLYIDDQLFYIELKRNNTRPDHFDLHSVDEGRRQ